MEARWWPPHPAGRVCMWALIQGVGAGPQALTHRPRATHGALSLPRASGSQLWQGRAPASPPAPGPATRPSWGPSGRGSLGYSPPHAGRPWAGDTTVQERSLHHPTALGRVLTRQDGPPAEAWVGAFYEYQHSTPSRLPLGGRGFPCRGSRQRGAVWDPLALSRDLALRLHIPQPGAGPPAPALEA